MAAVFSFADADPATVIAALLAVKTVRAFVFFFLIVRDIRDIHLPFQSRHLNKCHACTPLQRRLKYCIAFSAIYNPNYAAVDV